MPKRQMTYAEFRRTIVSRRRVRKYVEKTGREPSDKQLIYWGRGVAHDVIGGLLTPGDFFALIGILVAIFYAAGELGDTWIFVQEPAAALRRVFFFIDQDRDEDAHGDDGTPTFPAVRPRDSKSAVGQDSEPPGHPLGFHPLADHP